MTNLISIFRLFINVNSFGPKCYIPHVLVYEVEHLFPGNPYHEIKMFLQVWEKSKLGVVSDTLINQPTFITNRTPPPTDYWSSYF